MASVLAAFFSRLASSEICFFSFLGFRRSFGVARGARSSVWQPMLEWRIPPFLCLGQEYLWGVLELKSSLWEEGESSMVSWCFRGFWLGASLFPLFPDKEKEVVFTIPLSPFTTYHTSSHKYLIFTTSANANNNNRRLVLGMCLGLYKIPLHAIFEESWKILFRNQWAHFWGQCASISSYFSIFK